MARVKCVFATIVSQTATKEYYDNNKWKKWKDGIEVFFFWKTRKSWLVLPFKSSMPKQQEKNDCFWWGHTCFLRLVGWCLMLECFFYSKEENEALFSKKGKASLKSVYLACTFWKRVVFSSTSFFFSGVGNTNCLSERWIFQMNMFLFFLLSH